MFKDRRWVLLRGLFEAELTLQFFLQNFERRILVHMLINALSK